VKKMVAKTMKKFVGLGEEPTQVEVKKMVAKTMKKFVGLGEELTSSDEEGSSGEEEEEVPKTVKASEFLNASPEEAPKTTADGPKLYNDKTMASPSKAGAKMELPIVVLPDPLDEMDRDLLVSESAKALPKLNDQDSAAVLEAHRQIRIEDSKKELQELEDKIKLLEKRRSELKSEEGWSKIEEAARVKKHTPQTMILLQFISLVQYLPKRAQAKICSFLTSGQMFKWRFLGSGFRAAFFEQRVTGWNYDAMRFNPRQAVLLARNLGRIFPRVEALDFSPLASSTTRVRLTKKDLQNMGASFPGLRRLWVRGADLLPGPDPKDSEKRQQAATASGSLCDLVHPRLEFLQVHVEPSELIHLSEERFPKLQNLCIAHTSRPLANLPPHSRIWRLDLRIEVNAVGWDTLLTRKRYPRLKKIEILRSKINLGGAREEDLAKLPELKTRLRDAGIKLVVHH